MIAWHDERDDEVLRAWLSARLTLGGVDVLFETLADAPGAVVEVALDLARGQRIPPDVVATLAVGHAALLGQRSRTHDDDLSIGSLIDIYLRAGAWWSTSLPGRLENAMREDLSAHDLERIGFLLDSIERETLAVLGRIPTDTEIDAMMDDADFDEDEASVDGLPLLRDLRRLAMSRRG